MRISPSPAWNLERECSKRGVMQDLTAEFPDSDWISATAAMAQYNLRNFDEAQELYEDLLERDPHRIDVSLSHMQHFLVFLICSLPEPSLPLPSSL